MSSPSTAATACAAGPPLASAVVDGVTHRVWALADSSTLQAIAGDLLSRRAVIADGHHRYATYLRHQADRHAAGAGAGPWDRGLALLVDASTYGPQVHAIHRYVPGLSLAAAVDRASSGFTVQDVPEASALSALAAAGKAGTAFVVAGPEGRWLLTDPGPAELAAYLPSEASEAWRSLDVTVAHHLLVRTVGHLADDEHTVWYRHDAPAAEAAAAETGGTALLHNPTPVEAVIAVAAAGERMPRKSTYFTPKPRTGFVLRAFADDA